MPSSKYHWLWTGFIAASTQAVNFQDVFTVHAHHLANTGGCSAFQQQELAQMFRQMQSVSEVVASRLGHPEAPNRNLPQTELALLRSMLGIDQPYGGEREVYQHIVLNSASALYATLKHGLLPGGYKPRIYCNSKFLEFKAPSDLVPDALRTFDDQTIEQYFAGAGPEYLTNNWIFYTSSDRRATLMALPKASWPANDNGMPFPTRLGSSPTLCDDERVSGWTFYPVPRSNDLSPMMLLCPRFWGEKSFGHILAPQLVTAPQAFLKHLDEIRPLWTNWLATIFQWILPDTVRNAAEMKPLTFPASKKSDYQNPTGRTLTANTCVQITDLASYDLAEPETTDMEQRLAIGNTANRVWFFIAVFLLVRTGQDYNYCINMPSDPVPYVHEIDDISE